MYKILAKGIFIFNAKNTGDQKTMNGQPWIEYWKTITGLAVPDICPFCGESLNEDDAEGCHVIIAKDIEVSIKSIAKMLSDHSILSPVIMNVIVNLKK